MLSQDAKKRHLASRNFGFDWVRVVGNIFAVLLLIRGVAFLSTEDIGLFQYEIQMCAYLCIGFSFVCFILSNRRQGVYELQPNPPSAKETKSALKEFKE